MSGAEGRTGTNGAEPRALAIGTLFGLAAWWGRRRYAQRLARTVTGTEPGVLADDGVLLHVETDGPVGAPLTVVFAHGFSVDMGEYDAQKSFLRDDFRLVFFDQRGHGRSGWGGQRKNIIAQLGRDLGRVIDECSSNGPVVVVGHSMGGMAVMALAQVRPELFGPKVVAAALLSTSAGRVRLGISPRVARIAFQTGAFRALLFLVWFVAPLTDRLRPVRTGVGRRVVRRLLFGIDPAPEHLVSRLQDKWAGTSRAVAAAFYPQMLGHDTSPSLGVLADIPVLVLTGDADAIISPSHSDEMAAAIGGRARVIRVPRAGHMVNMTHAAAVNEELRRLLRDAVAGLGGVDAGRAAPGAVHRSVTDRFPGAEARYPTGIPRAGWKQVARRVWNETQIDQVPLLAAGVAFWGFISLFPAMVAAVAVYGLVADPSTVTRQAAAITDALPRDAASLLVDQMQTISSQSQNALSLSLALSVLLALWTSSAAVSNMMSAINTAYDEEETRGYVRRKAIAVLLSLGAILFVVLAVGLIALAPVLLDTFAPAGATRAFLGAGRWVGLVLTVLIGTAVIYKVAPDRNAPRLAWVSVGSIVATAVWLLASVGFSLYVDNFGRYSRTYGSLAGVAILMLWLWITALIVLVGAELNAEAEQQTTHDTTVGEPRPMGKRHAVKADSWPDAKHRERKRT